MPSRKKILIVDSDLDLLSRFYLGLMHRSFKVEATNEAGEIKERIKSLRPSLVILGDQSYLSLISKKTPCIILLDKDEKPPMEIASVKILEKPVSVDRLVRSVQEML